ncbi:MAG: hypothetical protein ACFB0B_07855 [Thermonemataceae bacterium]
MHKTIQILLIITLCLTTSVQAQRKKVVSLEDIWQRYTFYPKSVELPNWMYDGQYYTALLDNEVIQYEVVTNQPVKTLVAKERVGDLKIAAYELNRTEDQLILQGNVTPIYRRSFKADYYVFDTKSEQLT